MTKSERANMYVAYLHEEGYRPNTDGDGDVVFKAEGKTFVIIIDDKDEQFFRLIFPNFWRAETEDQRKQVLDAADFATARTKVAKVFLVEDRVWASIELFLPSPDQFRDIFARSMGALQAGAAAFTSRMIASPGGIPDEL